MTPARDPNDLIARLFALAAQARPPAMFGSFRYVADPDAAAEILAAPDVFLKDYGAIALLGRSRLGTNGDEWRARRDLTQPGFKDQSRPANRPRIAGMFDAALPAGPAPGVEEIMQAVMRVTAQIFLDGLGAALSSDRLIFLFGAYRDAVFEIQRGSICDGADMQNRRRPRETAEALAASFRDYCADEPEMGRVFERWEQTYRGPAPLGPHGEFLHNVFAGFETASATIGWAIDRLGADPALQERLRTEPARAGRLAFDRFIDEVLRYFPAIPFISRVTAAEHRSPHLQVRAGEQILLSIIGVHRAPGAWTNPLCFDADRIEFMDGAPPRNAYIPFSSGQRTCGGAALARVEVEEGVTALLRRFRFTRAPEAPIRFHYALSLRPWFGDSIAVERL